jgi:uncharacterized protein (PEP-CTERM system associated)
MAKRSRAPAAGSGKLAAPVAVLALLLSPQCRADWKVTPAVELRETYSDNVQLTTDQLARSQLITDLAPSLAITNNGPRLKLAAAFTTHLFAYSNDRIEGTNSSQRQLAANAKAKLIENLLFFESTASIDQRAVSAFGPQVADNGYSNTNRTEVSTWRISPYLSHRFGSAATAELRYARDSVKSGDASFGDSIGNTVSTSISSGPAFRTIGWGLQASHQDLDSTRGGESTSDTASAQLNWRVSEALSLNANRGYDKYDYKALEGDTAGPSYSLGLVWAPSRRTQLQASAGKRYYGNSYMLNATHRSRHTVWNISYNDAVTTTRGEFLRPVSIDTASLLDGLFSAAISDPVARQQAVAAYILSNGLPASVIQNTNAFSNRYILQKQFQASAAFNTAKTVTLFSLNATKRNALSTPETAGAAPGSLPANLPGSGLDSLNDNIKQAGAALSFNYRISPRGGANLIVSKTRTESLATGIKDDQLLLSLGLTRQLQRKLRGAVELHRVRGNALTVGGRTYTENALSATLSQQF